MLDLADDLRVVTGKDVIVQEEPESIVQEGYIYLVGTVSSNQLIAQIPAENRIKLTKQMPGKRGVIIQVVTLANDKQILLLGGSDVLGAMYSVF